MGAAAKPLKIYKASAGSGKTYALAKAYVKLLIRQPDAYRRILAITFTRKATAEMKSRILRFLCALRDGQDPVLREAIIRELREEYGFDPTPVLEANAGKALSMILHDYAHFQVTTIDSYFQHIIRSFARELQLPAGMTVELDTGRVLAACVDALMEDYERDGAGLSAWLESFAFSHMDESKGWKIERNLLKMSEELLKEHYHELHPTGEASPGIDAFRRIFDEKRAVIRTYRDTLRSMAATARSGMTAANVDPSLYSRGFVRSFLRKADDAEFESIETVRKLTAGDDDPVPQTKRKSHPAEAERASEHWHRTLKGQCAAILQYHEANSRSYNTAVHIVRHIHALALLEALADKLKAYRDEENTLLISDASQIIGRIAEAESSPFIFEKTGAFLRYLLIDEFQDTSQLQWRGLLPLVIETLAQGSGLTLIVGDPKQSIYRWRGGKMELLLKEIDRDLRGFREQKSEVTLNTNFRSAPAIVRFNNELFEAIRRSGAPDSLFALAYEGHEQAAANPNLQGYVDCRWLDQPKGGEDVVLPELLSILRDAGARRPWKDICILVRSNAQAGRIAAFLSRTAPDIPFLSGESLLVQNALSVKLIVAALEYITWPRERFYYHKLNYLYSCLHGKAAPETVLHREAPPLFPAELHPGRSSLARYAGMTLDELVPALIRLFGLDTQNDAYMLRFQDIVFDQVAEKELSVAAFVEHWREQQSGYAILPPESMDAVTISTIHKAKGLEYPVVLLPYLDWSLAPKAGSVFWGKGEGELPANLQHFPLNYQKGLAETAFAADYERETELGYVDILNVLYVALTRPREALYILCRNREKKNNNTVSALLRELLPALDLPGAVSEGDRFRYGGGYAAQTGSATAETEAVLPVLALHDFRAAISLREKEFKGERMWEGDVLHDLLAGIETPEDLSRSLNRVALTYGLNEANKAEQAHKARAVMQFFEEKGWTSAQYRRLQERPIVFRGKELRPDMVLYNETDCIIVDYKTGAKKADHLDQLREYGEAYAALLQVPVRACLLYTKDMELLEL